MKKKINIILAAALAFSAAGASFFQKTLLVQQPTVTVSSATTTTLAATSNQTQITTGATTHSYKMPDATTLIAGTEYDFVNESSGTVTIFDNDNTLLATVRSNQAARLWLTSNASAPGVWRVRVDMPESTIKVGNLQDLSTDFATQYLNTTRADNLYHRKTSFIDAFDGLGSAPVKTREDGFIDSSLLDPTIGTGDVGGPASSTDNAIARWNGTSGNAIQDSSSMVFDDGAIGVATTSSVAILDAYGGLRVGLSPQTLTTVVGSHTAADTTINVHGTSNYPERGTLVIASESIAYTGKTATSFTGATRGALGSTAAALSGGEEVTPYLAVFRAQESLPRMVVTGAGNVGIGTTVPSSLLHLVGTAMAFDRYGSNPTLTIRRANGTASAPTQVLSGQTIASVAGNGYSSSGEFTSGSKVRMMFLAAEDFTGTSTGTHLQFETTPIGSTSVTPRVRITSEGAVGIGTTLPTSSLDVRTSTGGITTLSRSDSSAVSNDSIGKLQFWNNDNQLTTQNIFGDIEVQAAQTISTDAAAGNMIFRTTGTTVAGSPVERLRIDSSGQFGVGNITPNHTFDINGTFGYRKTDVLLAGNLDSLGTATTSVVKLTGVVTALRGMANGADGKLVTVINGTGGTFTISNENSNPSAANRIITGSGSDVSISDGATVLFQYDSGSTRWRMVSPPSNVAGASVGGSTTQIQYNDAGALAGDSSLIWLATSDRMGIAKTPDTNLDINGTTAVSKNDVLLGGNIDDLGSATSSLIRLTHPSALTLRGIANGTDGKMLTIMNATTKSITVANENANPTAANRILTGTSANITIATDAVVRLQYDSGASRWRVAGAPSSSGGSGGSGVGTVSYSSFSVGAGHGSTNTKIRRMSVANANVGTLITASGDSAANGNSWTINANAFCSVSYSDKNTGGTENLCITVNDSAMTTNCDALTYAQGMRMTAAGPSGEQAQVHWSGPVSSGDVIRAHDNGAANVTAAEDTTFSISCVPAN